MRTSIWYRTEEKQPSKTGHYLTYRGWGMGGKGDGDSDHGYLWYSKERNEWYEYERAWQRGVSFVYYWTDADPLGWTDQDPPSIRIKPRDGHQHIAVQDAWNEVEEAIKRYEVVKALAQT